MDSETFGSTKKYKTLGFLVEKVSLMEAKHKGYISSFMQDMNTTVKKTELIQVDEKRKYVLDLIHLDFKSRIESSIKPKYDEKITSYMENFLNARIKKEKTK